MGRSRRHLTTREVLELSWLPIVDLARREPDLIDRVVETLARAVRDPGVLAWLPDDEAKLIAHVASLGLGELLERAFARGGDRRRE